MRILDVGSGIHPLENADTIDFADLPNLTYKHNLNVFPYPVKDKSYDLIYCSNTLEHLEDVPGVLKEFERILKNNGEIIIKVPYLTSNNAFECLDHKHYFTYFSFDYYVTNPDPKRNMEIWFFPQMLQMKYKKLHFIKNGVRCYNWIVEWFANKYPLHYESLFKYIFPAYELEVRLGL